MWIITEHGFFTFVTDRKDPSMVWLRARVREDLERNFPGVEVIEKPGSDYLYRAKVTRVLLAERMAQMVMDSNITSHFKDVALSKAPAQGKADRRSAYYGLWTALAKLQPYAPYSKFPRGQEPKVSWGGGWKDRRPGNGQTALPTTGGSSRYTSDSHRYASDFDWDSRDWGTPIGASAADPAFGVKDPEGVDIDLSSDFSEEEWAALSQEEQQEILDREEALLRSIEAQEDFGAAARVAQFSDAAQMAYPAPRNRPGSRKSRKQRRKDRRNRHNQNQTDADQERFFQERRDGKHGQEARNRQTYLDRQNGVKQG